MTSFWVTLSVALCCANSVRAADWKPVDPAELAEKKPQVEANAGAEALLWEVRVTDETVVASAAPSVNMQRGNLQGVGVGSRAGMEQGPVSTSSVLEHYLRIKIFNNYGRDRFATVHIPYNSQDKVTDISGRTIQPDGTILDLAKNSVFDSTTTWGDSKSGSKAFAMPGVTAGAIIEYRWRETRPYIPGYQELQFQQYDLPVRLVHYLIKPSPARGAMLAQDFNCPHTPFVKEGGGFYGTTLANVRALRYEPNMPPLASVRSWVLLYYRKEGAQPPARFWHQQGVSTYEERSHQRYLEVNRDVRKIAAEVTGGAPTGEEKLTRLSDYCRMHIRTYGQLTAGERLDAKPNTTPADTLNQKLGRYNDIQNAFAAMAIAAGFDARVARLPPRNQIIFDPSFADTYFLRSRAIAVRVGDQWRFYDPGTTYLPGDMLPAHLQGVQALISDPKNPIFVRTPVTPPKASTKHNTGVFRLSEDGTLDGDAVMEFTGIEGALKKQADGSRSDAQRNDDILRMLSPATNAGRGGAGARGNFGNAEVSEIKVENATDPVKPFTYRFHLHVPAYAQLTGKRLLIAPAVFEQGLPVRFTATERTQPVTFDHAWMETDSVTIELPPGFDLDNADMPPPFTIGKLGGYQAEAAVAQGKLLYARQFVFGEGGLLSFPTSAYTGLKTAFDALHNADTHTITLKQADAPTGGGK